MLMTQIHFSDFTLSYNLHPCTHTLKAYQGPEDCTLKKKRHTLCKKCKAIVNDKA